MQVVEGLGATADVMLANGTLKRGDRIVMCGFSGPVVTRVRELLTPKPLRELRVKTDYLHHDHIDGSAGIKICANHLEGVVAGSACLVPYVDVPYDLEVLKEDAMIDLNKLAKAASEVNGGVGVYAMSSTLGSLEALLEFLKSSKIPVSAVNIGPIHKRDVIKASIMHEHRSEYATILAFDVPFSKETEQQAKELNVKVFTADIIYHLFDKFTAYMAEVCAYPSVHNRCKSQPICWHTRACAPLFVDASNSSLAACPLALIELLLRFHRPGTQGTTRCRTFRCGLSRHLRDLVARTRLVPWRRRRPITHWHQRFAGHTKKGHATLC